MLSLQSLFGIMLVSVITGSDAQTLAFTQSAFSYCITNLAPGAIVGTIGATIPSGTTGTWSLTGGNSNFAINPTSGKNTSMQRCLKY
jgi:hypothetical protein